MALSNNLILRSPRSGRLEGRTGDNPAVAETGSGATALVALPEWDLGDLYPGRGRPELAGDLAALAADATSFRDRHQGRLPALPRAGLGPAGAAHTRPRRAAVRLKRLPARACTANHARP